MLELEGRTRAEDAVALDEIAEGPTVSGGEGPTVSGTVEASGAVVAG